MYRSISLRVLISIKSTMLIVGGYHGIRLYEREIHPHDLRKLDIAKLNHFAAAISSDARYSEPFKLHMTIMASICCFLSWHHLTSTASS